MFLKDVMNSAFHFLGSFTDLYDVFKLQTRNSGEKKTSENHSKVQSDDIKQPVRLTLSMEDYEMTQRSGKEHTAIPQPWPCSHHVALLQKRAQRQQQEGQVGRQLLEQPCVPALPLYSTQGYASGARNKSYSVPAVVSKAAATGCSSCLLLEQLLHWVRWCWQLAQLLAVQFSGLGRRRFKHYLFLLLSPAGVQWSWCLAWWICCDTDPPPPSSIPQKLQSAMALKTLSRKERGTQDKERGTSDICVFCSNKGVCHTTP